MGIVFCLVVGERERESLRLGVEAICANEVAGLEEAIAFFLELQRLGHGGGDLATMTL